MQKFLSTLILLSLCGCAACQSSPPTGGGPGGIPMSAMTASTAPPASGDAIPAVGIGWHTVCFSIPKPRLFAVPRPQPAPQVVGIPILAGAPQMTMVQPQFAPAQQFVASPPGQPQQQYIPAQPTPSPQPQSQPGCGDSCAPEGCNTSHHQMMHECDALIRDIAQLQQELSVETPNASVRTRQ